MTTHEFNNDSNQAERRRVQRDTYHTRTVVDDELGGRFKKQSPTIIGSTPAPSYPKQPANSPWSSDPVPATEPLGFSVDAMEPVGTPEEIEKSIRADNSDRSSTIASPTIEQGDGLSAFSSKRRQW